MARNSFLSLATIALLVFLAAAPLPPSEEETYRKANELVEGGNWKIAYPMIESELQRLAGSDGDNVWRWRVLQTTTLLGRGDSDKAAEVLAMPLPPRLAETEIGVRWTLNVAVAAYRGKRYDKATTLFDLTEKRARKSHPRLIAKVLIYRASQKFFEKQVDAGLRYALESIQEAHKYKDVPVEMKAVGTVALLLTMQGRYTEAIEADKKAIVMAQSLGDESALQKTTGNLGWAYATIGEYELAYDCFNQALELSLKLEAGRDSVPWLNQFGDALRRNGDNDAALRKYQQAVMVARKTQHPELSESLTNLGKAQLDARDLRGARTSIDRALEAGDNEQKLVARLLDARFDQANGALTDAITKCRVVIAAKSSKPLRWEAQWRLAQMYVEAKRPAEAEREFQLSIETTAAARKAISSEELRLPFGALVREVNDAYVDFLVSVGKPEEALLAAEHSRAQTLEEALKSGERTHRDSPNPQRIAHNRDAVILDYWLAKQRSFVWIVTDSSIVVKVLPAARAIDQQIKAYNKQIATLGSSEQALLKSGTDLFTTLVGPVAERIDRKSVIVVPDGQLHAFNMETLVVPKTHGYWIHDVSILTAPSLELLRRAQPAAAQPALLSAAMLIVGNPTSPDAEKFPQLMSAHKEIDLVARQFHECTILEGPRATLSEYENAHAERFGNIDFVTHSVATPQVPLDSAIILARDSVGFKLYAREIIKHPLRAQLVTISGCDGAGARAYTGEGLVGLAWAFLHAGAHHVIAALWEVNDNATPKLMGDLYEGIRSGRDPATALRDAKLRLINGGTVYRYPKYWAPFVLYSGS